MREREDLKLKHKHEMRRNEVEIKGKTSMNGH
jgi:hypothetical protein